MVTAISHDENEVKMKNQYETPDLNEFGTVENLTLTGQCGGGDNQDMSSECL
jgi:hypothetical protein